MHAEPLRDRTQGRWRSILPLLGLEASFLTGKNTACPWCGGKDRWRFINRDGSGNWICNCCGKGDGLMLAQRVTGTDFAATAVLIEKILGEAPPDKETPRPEVSRDAMRRLWSGAVPLAGTPGERYFKRRGLAAPRCLRYSPRVWYDRDASAPAILAQVAGPDGWCVNLYRIFVTQDGEKAPMDRPKRMMRAPVPFGAAVRLAPKAPILGLAEGIENACAVMGLFGMPTWATLGTEFMERFIIPPGVEELVIWADADENYAGQKAAYSRANRAVMIDKIRARVEVPPKFGIDWNDAWILSASRDAVAATSRSAILL